MSLKPSHILQAPYFYPAGNTPAVCLSQSLPPDQDATLLLLGCGDIRNILFTVYSGAGNNDRKLDFTCCDLEAEIIARNILVLTIILDDTEGARVHQLWDIYYHVFIDRESFELLHSQAKKFLNLAQSMEAWDQGPYATLLRFCDHGTLENVAKLWELYALDQSAGTTYTAAQGMLNEQWKAAKSLKEKHISGTGFPLDGLRSYAPLLVDGLNEIGKQYRTYWQSGTCFEEKKKIQGSKIANPMFACQRSGLVMHYGTNPLLGYHLGPLNARLSSDSPLKITNDVPKAMQLAISQLSVWCTALRKASGNLTIRYVNSDAVAFCHVLQHHRAHGESNSAHWYRNTWTFSTLVLDDSDYKQGGPAPTAFDVIDTSNLLDHLGCLNILATTASLIRQKPTSTLRTEMLLPRESNVADSAKTLLCGDLPTVALILGLKPVLHWANATSVWHLKESMFLDTPSMTGGAVSAAMSRPVVLWKPVDTSNIRYDADELARLVLAIYLNMFQDESWANRFSMLNIGNKELLQKKLTSYEVYSRASFVALLHHLKVSDVVDWSQFMDSLVLKGIMMDDTLNMGPHHFQALCAHLDMLSLWKLEDYFDWWHPRTFQQSLKGPFRDWKAIPTVLCVTLVVPHTAISAFDDLNKGNGTPICQLQTSSSISMKEAIHADIQMAFGNITTSGKAFTNDYRVTVHEDHQGWKGSSALIVSAMVPTCSLVEYGDPACRVIFGLKQTPVNMAQLASKFGMLLHLHQSAIGQKDVFVSQYRPNTEGHVTVNIIATSKPTAADEIKITVSPVLTQYTNKITSLRIRYDILHGSMRTLLQDGGAVQLNMPNPFRLVLTVGNKSSQELTLPFPLKINTAKTKIARKSLWIEYTAPVAEVKALSLRPDHMLPLELDKMSDVVLENLHYVQPDVLPKVQIGQGPAYSTWLPSLVAPLSTMSTKEFHDYQKLVNHETLPMPGRLGVKECLHLVYERLFGFSGQERANVFQLCVSKTFFAVIYVDSVRMDVSNQTVFIDAALVPFYLGREMQRVDALLYARNDQVACVFMKDDQVAFWKHLLAGSAERCRQWQHKSSCEYKVAGRIPISINSDKPYMCTCGFGVFPNDYIKDIKQPKNLLKHAVRVAIPLIFPSPINADDGNPLPSITRPSSQRNQENMPATPSPHQEARIEDVDAKKGTCFNCGATRSHDGSPLSKCSKCKVASYCCPECQRKDWKTHKLICKQLLEK